jgi:hypothetical protein
MPIERRNITGMRKRAKMLPRRVRRYTRIWYS